MKYAFLLSQCDPYRETIHRMRPSTSHLGLVNSISIHRGDAFVSMLLIPLSVGKLDVKRPESHDQYHFEFELCKCLSDAGARDPIRMLSRIPSWGKDDHEAPPASDRG